MKIAIPTGRFGTNDPSRSGRLSGIKKPYSRYADWMIFKATLITKLQKKEQRCFEWAYQKASKASDWSVF